MIYSPARCPDACYLCCAAPVSTSPWPLTPYCNPGVVLWILHGYADGVTLWDKCRGTESHPPLTGPVPAALALDSALESKPLRLWRDTVHACGLLFLLRLLPLWYKMLNFWAVPPRCCNVFFCCFFVVVFLWLLQRKITDFASPFF